MPSALLCLVMRLVVQLNSIRKPVIVLSTIVLALIGVVIGLVVVKTLFGFMTLLGVASLAGIVIDNAIVLIDWIQIEIEENGLEVRRAAIRYGLVFSTVQTPGCVPLRYTLLYRDKVDEDPEDEEAFVADGTYEPGSEDRTHDYLQEERWKSRLWSSRFRGLSMGEAHRGLRGPRLRADGVGRCQGQMFPTIPILLRFWRT